MSEQPSVNPHAKRLRASVRLDAVNGDTHERSVCARQMLDAADEIDRLQSRVAELERATAGAPRCATEGHVFVGTGDDRVVCDECGVERAHGSRDA